MGHRTVAIVRRMDEPADIVLAGYDALGPAYSTGVRGLSVTPGMSWWPPSPRDCRTRHESLIWVAVRDYPRPASLPSGSRYRDTIAMAKVGGSS